MDKLAHLREAIASNSTTTIIYHGGSAPGTARAISPISVTGDLLVARDLESKVRKTFKLDKVEIVTDQPMALYRDAMASAQKRGAISIEELFAEIEAMFDPARFAVVRNDQDISVHARWKNGNLRRAPIVAMYYRPIVVVDVWDDDAMDCGTPTRTDRPSARPWRVQGSTFANRAHAFDALRSACATTVASHASA